MKRHSYIALLKRTRSFTVFLGLLALAVAAPQYVEATSGNARAAARLLDTGHVRVSITPNDGREREIVIQASDPSSPIWLDRTDASRSALTLLPSPYDPVPIARLGLVQAGGRNDFKSQYFIRYTTSGLQELSIIDVSTQAPSGGHRVGAPVRFTQAAKLEAYDYVLDRVGGETSYHAATYRAALPHGGVRILLFYVETSSYGIDAPETPTPAPHPTPYPDPSFQNRLMCEWRGNEEMRWSIYAPC